MIVRIVAPAHGPRALRLLLQVLTDLDAIALKTGRFPPIYRSGVRYQREPRRIRECWKTIPAVLADGHGDCEDLACWRAAELCLQGEPAYPYIYRTKSGGWHVVVRRGDGSLEDPSRALGMGNVSRETVR